MNISNIINGKKIAEEIENSVKIEIENLILQYKVQPCLAVILVGQDPASQIYVRNKKKKAESLGIISKDFIMPDNINQKELLDFIHQLNRDETVHGILLQLPLPAHLNSFEAISAISPKKDVDGFNPHNVGLLNIGQPNFIPCTPKGCIYLIKTIEKDLMGMQAVVVGRSNVVGWPMARLLLNENCTVNVTHSKTKNLKELCLNADIIIAATGKRDLITTDMVSEKAIIIDVGINRYVNELGENKLIGDVDYVSLAPKVRGITPVPGGVGPMTIACLMENLLMAVKYSLHI